MASARTATLGDCRASLACPHSALGPVHPPCRASVRNHALPEGPREMAAAHPLLAVTATNLTNAQGRRGVPRAEDICLTDGSTVRTMVVAARRLGGLRSTLRAREEARCLPSSRALP